MYDFYNKPPKPELADKVVDWIIGPSREAAKAPPIVEGDGPITIHCGGKEEHWGSRWLAYHYYSTAGMACDGSEGARYSDIVAGIEYEYVTPSDGIPVRQSA